MFFQTLHCGAMQPHVAVTGRLAPSPTGLLHLGNAWAFLLAWLAARAAGGRVLLRMEDIDPQRSREEWARAVMEDLRWLGLDWDAGPDREDGRGPYAQSRRAPGYQAALERLSDGGHCYPCYCTRKELRQVAAAPHADDVGAPYAGRCRDLAPERRAALEARGRRPSLRLRCPDERIDFQDMIHGPQSFTLAQCGGDFALRRSDGVVAYQLAVVVDDAAMGVNHVVRGQDILASTPRQILLCRLLGLPVPRYAHVPLLLDENGERLAKRHQSLSLRALRRDGARPEAVTGLLGCLAGCSETPVPAVPGELLPAFRMERLPRGSARITSAMLARLRR